MSPRGITACDNQKQRIPGLLLDVVHVAQLVRVQPGYDCGSFTGTYTINEDDNYVWFKDYAWVMNLMCAIPIFGIVMLVWLIANHEHVTCFNRKKVRDWAASAQRRGSNVDLAARAEAQAETTESRCGGCLCCCGPRPDVLVEHEAQREARIAAHRGVLPGLEPGDA